MDDSRLVRDLLEANIKLTDHLVELTKLAIGVPGVRSMPGAPMAPSADIPQFSLADGETWEDIPETPLGAKPTNVLDFTRPTATLDPTLPLHMSEEEEDLRFAVAMDQAPPGALSDLLRKMQAPTDEITMHTQ